MFRALHKITDDLLQHLVTGGQAKAAADCWRAPCRLRTGRCEQTCCRDAAGTVTCDGDCVC